jgi:hypothetical protein
LERKPRAALQPIGPACADRIDAEPDQPLHVDDIIDGPHAERESACTRDVTAAAVALSTAQNQPSPPAALTSSAPRRACGFVVNQQTVLGCYSLGVNKPSPIEAHHDGAV